VREGATVVSTSTATSPTTGQNSNVFLASAGRAAIASSWAKLPWPVSEAMGILSKDAADTCRYMNFDQIEVRGEPCERNCYFTATGEKTAAFGPL
jgi:aconitase B